MPRAESFSRWRLGIFNMIITRYVIALRNSLYGIYGLTNKFDAQYSIQTKSCGLFTYLVSLLIRSPAATGRFYKEVRRFVIYEKPHYYPFCVLIPRAESFSRGRLGIFNTIMTRYVIALRNSLYGIYNLTNKFDAELYCTKNNKRCQPRNGISTVVCM